MQEWMLGTNHSFKDGGWSQKTQIISSKLCVGSALKKKHLSTELCLQISKDLCVCGGGGGSSLIPEAIAAGQASSVQQACSPSVWKLQWKVTNKVSIQFAHFDFPSWLPTCTLSLSGSLWKQRNIQKQYEANVFIAFVVHVYCSQTATCSFLGIILIITTTTVSDTAS